MLTLCTRSRVERVPLAVLHRTFGPYPTATHVFSTDRYINLLQHYLTEGKLPSGMCLLLRSIFPKTDIERYGDEYIRVGYHILKVYPSSTIALACRDKTIQVNSIYATIFGVLRDFIEDYPGEPVVVPFTSGEITNALSPELHTTNPTKLSTCLPCLQWLRPHRNTYFLEYDLTHIKAAFLLELSSSFTEGERDGLAEVDSLANARSGVSPGGVHAPLLPPNGGRGHCVLAHSRAVRDQVTLCEELFPSYPSWRLVNMIKHIGSPGVDEKLTTLLLTGYFADEYRETHRHLIHSTIYNTLCQDSLGWEDTKRLLSMLGIVSRELMNEEMAVMAPFGVGYPTNVLSPVGLEEKLGRIYPGVWSWRFFRDAQSEMKQSIMATQ